MAGQLPTRRRRASRLHPVRIAVLTLFCLLLSGTAGAAAYFFPVVVAGVAFALAFFLRLNPALILLAGGVLGAFALQKVEEEDHIREKDSGK